MLFWVNTVSDVVDNEVVKKYVYDEFVKKNVTIETTDASDLL